jgi:hypothetical protein
MSRREKPSAPYPRSTSVSTGVLDLIFSDVWGLAPNSVSRHKYYVSFIDDFSKFTWIYLLRQKSEVFFSYFRDFHPLLSVNLIVKSVLSKPIAEVNIKP